MTHQRSAGLSRRHFIAGTGAAGAGLVAVGAPAVLRAAENKDRVIVGMTQEPVQFNPLLYVNSGTENVPEACMFDALWDMDDQGQFIPNLAVEVPSRENGRISPDGLVWKITLKRDVKWSDGQPFTAKDVEFTYQTIMNPKVAIRSRSGFDLIKNLKVVDDQNVEIELSKPFTPFLWAWQNMHIVPQHILGGEADINSSAFNAKPIGTGPYTLKTRVAGSHMVYERNPDYHRGPAKIRQVIHKFVPDQLVLYGQGRTGEVDYVGLQGVPYDRWNEAEQLPNATSSGSPSPGCSSSTSTAASRSSATRRSEGALHRARDAEVDRRHLLRRLPAHASPTWHPPTGRTTTRSRRRRRNPDLAAKMLDEAGWRIGQDGVREKDGVKLAFTMSTTAGNQARQGCQALFQQNWKKIGVDMQIKNMPASVVWGEYTTQSQFDTLLVAWEPTVGMDPDYTARAHSKMIPVKDHQGSNYVQYQNPEVDKLLEAGVVETETEPSARRSTAACRRSCSRRCRSRRKGRRRRAR